MCCVLLIPTNHARITPSKPFIHDFSFATEFCNIQVIVFVNVGNWLQKGSDWQIRKLILTNFFSRLEQEFRLDVEVIRIIGGRISGYIRLIFNVGAFNETFIAGLKDRIQSRMPLKSDLDILSQKLA